MVKFSHVANLVELSNENKKIEKSKIRNIWNKMYGSSYNFHLKKIIKYFVKKNKYIYIYEEKHKKVNRGVTLTSQIFLIFNKNHEKWLIRRYPKQKLHIINGFEVRASYVMRYMFFLINFWKTVIIISFFYYEKISPELYYNIFLGWLYP